MPVGLQSQRLPRAVLDAELGRKLEESLVKEGLYPREAAAMVKPWKDSWFEEEGLRVLYVLPRAWTARTLPMEMQPEPAELTRVMVGRAEVLSPATEQQLTLQIQKAKQGDAEAAREARRILKGLGRFAPPAFYRALDTTRAQPEERVKLIAFLNAEPGAN